MKKLLIPLILALLASGAARAQVDDYQKQAGELASLYRGRTQNPYPFRFNGTYYLETRLFREGRVWYNGKEYHNVLLNLDAYAMELVTRPYANSGAIILFRDQVAWFTLGERRFVNLRYLGYGDAPEGYFEVVRDGRTPLLRQVWKKFRTETLNRETPELDGNFDPTVPNVFVPAETDYVLEESGHLKKLGKRAFARRLKEAQNPAESPLGAPQWHPEKDVFEGGLPHATAAVRGTGLPDGYFREEQTDTTQVQYAENALTATFRNKIYAIGEAGKARGDRATVSGTVFEAESGGPLPGVVIYDDKTSTYVRSDAHGRYRISLPLGENLLNFNAESKEDLVLKIDLASNGTLDVVMTEKVTLLKGAIVSAESMRQHRTTAMGVEKVTMSTINKIPTAFGEGDVLKAVLTLPGVKTAGDAAGGFNVRGGSADQNLVLFNESTLYYPSHLFGLFSSFNPDVVDQVELYKSSIPAEFGGRISSVLDIHSKDGDTKKVRGSLGIGLLTSRAHLEGPLGKKTSFLAGARTSYSDWLLKLLPENSAYAGGSAGFTDVNLGLTHRFDENNTLQAYGYYSTDRFSFSGDTTFRYTNINASLVYRHKGEDDSSLQVSTGYDHFFNRLGIHDWEYGAYDLDTYIRQAFLKAVRRRSMGNHLLSYGAHLVGYGLDPGILSPFGEYSEITARSLDREYALEPSAFLSDAWQITDHFSVEGGIRASGYAALQPTKFYVGPEFRLSAKYSPRENLSFKAGANTLRQYIHLISNTTSISPMDTWKLSDADIPPTTGWQVAGGTYWTHLGTGLDLSLEGYWKQMSHCLDYKPGAVLSMNPDLAEALVPVYGKAWGVEAMVKRSVGSLTGWLSYSYSRAQYREMEDRGNETINYGNWYNAPYDKPHEFKMAANWAFTHRFSLSVNVEYSTGRPVTIPIGTYYYGGSWRLAYSERNSYRIPDYFRTDLALNIDPGHYLKALAHASFTIGVYNVTGRKNPYSVFFRTTGTGHVNGYMLSVFATQIPYVNLNILF